MLRLRPRHEHRLSRITALLVPRGGHITLEVQLHEVADEVFWHLVPGPVDAVRSSGAAPVADAGSSTRTSESLSPGACSLEPIRNGVSSPVTVTASADRSR